MSKQILQEQYNTILHLIPIACVDICIMNNSGVLLVKRNTEPAKGQWWVPGGRVYKGEMLKECALRKAKEEVGLECMVGPIVHTDETVFETGPFNIPVHSINVAFLLVPKTIDVKLDKYSLDYKWVNSIDSDFHPYVQKCLEGCGLNYLN
jgi:colanic acid biosynthesis protein WcaH